MVKIRQKRPRRDAWGDIRSFLEKLSPHASLRGCFGEFSSFFCGFQVAEVRVIDFSQKFPLNE
jgi:hypothetical protein